MYFKSKRVFLHQQKYWDINFPKKYYDLLDLSPGATEQEIKKAFRIKAKLFHPDASKNDLTSVEFQKIVEAYQVLTGQIKVQSSADVKAKAERRKTYTKEEIDEILKRAEFYKKEQKKREESQAIKDFEKLKQSFFYKAFPYVAIGSFIVSTILILDFFTPINKRDCIISKVEITEFVDETKFVPNVEYHSSLWLNYSENKKTTFFKTDEPIYGFVEKGKKIKLHQSSILKLNYGIELYGIYIKNYHHDNKITLWFLIVFLLLPVLTILFKGATPIYYLLLHMSTIFPIVFFVIGVILIL